MIGKTNQTSQRICPRYTLYVEQQQWRYLGKSCHQLFAERILQCLLGNHNLPLGRLALLLGNLQA